MDPSINEIDSMIFKRTVRDDLGGVSLDRQALVVLMELDGRIRLDALAAKLSISMAAMRDIISNLAQLGLVEKVVHRAPAVDRDFFRYLLEQLALAVGPIAGVLIEDEVQDLGYDLLHFPSDQAAALVNKLALEIRRERKKVEFLRKMTGKVGEKGYGRR